MTVGAFHEENSMTASRVRLQESIEMEGHEQLVEIFTCKTPSRRPESQVGFRRMCFDSDHSIALYMA